jgi:aspartate 1-decarboxylase
MLKEYLLSKIHMARVTDANLNYQGSLTLDPVLMEAAGISQFQRVLVSNFENTNRWETYVIEGTRGRGDVCLNGPGALLGKAGDRLIVMAFGQLSPEEVASHRATVVQVTDDNKIRVSSPLLSTSLV